LKELHVLYYICNDLRWDAHVDALCSKVASRLYLLKLLKRSGLSADDLFCFNFTCSSGA